LFATFEQAAKQTQRSPEKTRKRSYIRALVSPLRHAVVVSSREGKMQTPSISIYAAAAAVVALLWYLSARRFRMASTSQELLDLFEERQAVLEEQATSSSSHDQGKASEFATAAASVDLAPKGDKLGNPFARCFRLGRESDKPFVPSELCGRLKESHFQTTSLI
jgi:hypothetical protein